MKSKLKTKTINILKNLVKSFDGVLISKSNHDELLSQRNKSLSFLIKLEKMRLKDGLYGIIFSKDRALQLYSLLNSYSDLVINKVPLTIIYKTSNKYHEKSYNELKKIFLKKKSQFNFIKEESSFYHTLLKLLKKINVKNIFFLVDDIVFIKKTNLNLAKKIDSNKYILSLRHSPKLNRSYTANTIQPPPNISKHKDLNDILEFNWFEKGNEWSDPWSVDGQILSTAEVRAISKISNFYGPNTFETSLKTFNSICTNRKGLCYANSKILNLPFNRVQNEVFNLSGKITPEYLLDKWNEGMMLDTNYLLSYSPTSTHEEHKIKLKKR